MNANNITTDQQAAHYIYSEKDSKKISTEKRVLLGRCITMLKNSNHSTQSKQLHNQIDKIEKILDDDNVLKNLDHLKNYKLGSNFIIYRSSNGIESEILDNTSSLLHKLIFKLKYLLFNDYSLLGNVTKNYLSLLNKHFLEMRFPSLQR
jgi:hypothetical protein